LDNISIAYLVKEWAEETRSPTFFLKLDFKKAFDRMDFEYLWKTLETLGLRSKFLQLVKGLVVSAEAKVIVNGLYTDPIPLNRGVRQGDPLAPLLFVISTQPLILFMDHQISMNLLPAIHVNEELKVCQMLFADDVGIFIPATENAFLKLKDCISLYESASGAKLNLQKLIITPIATDIIQPWIINTGCQIASEGKINKYLGAPFGINLTNSAVQNFCLNKLAKQITELKPKCISFTGRVQLIKHVLLAMPIYHMMYTHLQKSTVTKIERLCREFLWGHNK
jgi:hypothetical protein